MRRLIPDIDTRTSSHAHGNLDRRDANARQTVGRDRDAFDLTDERPDKEDAVGTETLHHAWPEVSGHRVVESLGRGRELTSRHPRISPDASRARNGLTGHTRSGPSFSSAEPV